MKFSHACNGGKIILSVFIPYIRYDVCNFMLNVLLPCSRRWKHDQKLSSCRIKFEVRWTVFWQLGHFWNPSIYLHVQIFISAYVICAYKNYFLVLSTIWLEIKRTTSTTCPQIYNTSLHLSNRWNELRISNFIILDKLERRNESAHKKMSKTHIQTHTNMKQNNMHKYSIMYIKE